MDYDKALFESSEKLLGALKELAVALHELKSSQQVLNGTLHEIVGSMERIKDLTTSHD